MRDDDLHKLAFNYSKKLYFLQLTHATKKTKTTPIVLLAVLQCFIDVSKINFNSYWNIFSKQKTLKIKISLI